MDLRRSHTSLRAGECVVGSNFSDNFMRKSSKRPRKTWVPSLLTQDRGKALTTWENIKILSYLIKKNIKEYQRLGNWDLRPYSPARVIREHHLHYWVGAVIKVLTHDNYSHEHGVLPRSHQVKDIFHKTSTVLQHIDDVFLKILIKLKKWILLCEVQSSKIVSCHSKFFIWGPLWRNRICNVFWRMSEVTIKVYATWNTGSFVRMGWATFFPH